MLTQSSVPNGTIATLGHPSNRILVAKVAGSWLRVANGEPVDPEDFRAGWDPIYMPML